MKKVNWLRVWRITAPVSLIPVFALLYAWFVWPTQLQNEKAATAYRNACFDAMTKQQERAARKIARLKQYNDELTKNLFWVTSANETLVKANERLAKQYSLREWIAEGAPAPSDGD